ncbi:exosome complex component RRP46-like [Formica exsecta]|uniref:exosome complex component RRP46-like n=1 Tax=Formica exsecta TaxID=72781 RepID=UPI001141CA1A|nr:exosome complex component RRP46-like [Formica exsecta]
MTEENTEIDCVLRPMNCEINLLSRSDGSTMFMQGDTAIIAGVNGPMEVRSQKMAYDKVSVEVTYTPLKGPAKIDDRLIETYIRETCESAILVSMHPNTMVCINLQEMQDFGGLLACAINASCLALINSGLSMKYTIAAINCMIEKETGKVIIDPDSTQLKNAKAAPYERKKITSARKILRLFAGDKRSAYLLFRSLVREIDSENGQEQRKVSLTGPKNGYRLRKIDAPTDRFTMASKSESGYVVPPALK